ncbi:MAG: hypothetical protein J6D00_07910 [Christensenellaceae bacterium]|nr:hypothetical protein [Christensenellaceae bacterium]
MKKLIALVLVLVLLFVGCKKDEFVFQAEILEIHEGTYLVEPLEGTTERKSSDQIYVPIKHVDAPREPLIGDIIEITYNGMLMETYPAQIGEFYKIRLIEE